MTDLASSVAAYFTPLVLAVEQHPWSFILAAGVAFIIYLFATAGWELKDINLKGPKCYPVIGTAHELIKDKGQVHLTFGRLVKEYGDMFKMYFFSQPSVIISDPKHAQTILTKEFSKFHDRPRGGLEVPEPFPSMLTGLRGERWKNVRRLVSPAYTTGKLKLVTGIMRKASNTMISVIGNAADKEESVDFHSTMRNFTLDIILQAAFGIDSNCQIETDGVIAQYARQASDPSRWISFTILIPFIGKKITKWILPTKYGLRLGNLQKVAEQIIKQRQKKWKEGERFQDMLGMALDAQLSEKSGLALTDNEVLGQSVIFLLAGFDTSGVTLGMLCYHLALDQTIQERLHKEVVDVFGDGPVEYEDLSKLVYLDACVSEVLRLYPPGFAISRDVTEDCIIDGVKIKKGMGVVIPAYSLHRDSRYWDQPEKFNPDRFMPENADKITPFTYMPFGCGPRNCVGMRFAQLEIRFAMCHLIRKYRLLPAPDLSVPIKVMVKNILTIDEPVKLHVASR